MADKEDKKPMGAPEVPKDVAKQLHHENNGEKPEKPAPGGDTSKNETSKESETGDKKEKLEDTEHSPLEDKQTDEAVEDIIRNESDELLAAQDQSTPKVEPERKARWWKRAWLRWSLLLLLLAAVGLMVYPTTRYWILNNVGVRASASVMVVDRTTGQPLKNVKVSVGTSEGTTGSDGKATVRHLKLGPQKLKLERIAFASLERNLTVGWGSNPLGTFELEAIGAQYTVIVRDFLANKPIEAAEASSGQAAALSDKEGKAVLTLEESDGSDVTATVAAPGYRSEEVTLKADTAVPNEVLLVPSAKEVFVSRESGKYDVFTIDIDGKNKKVLLAGTGRESGNIGLSVSPDGSFAALVSTRDDVRASDGRLLNTLTLINVSNGETLVLDRGEQIQLIDWIGNRVVYQMVANVAANSTDRQRIVSYDAKTNSRALIANASQIRSAASAWGGIYFNLDGKYYRTNADGTHKQTVLEKDVWVSYRTSYGELSLQTSEGWYRLDLRTGNTASIGEPSNYASRIFVTNQEGEQALWIDKSVLQLYNIDANTSAALHNQAGLTYPVRWLTGTVAVFRVVTSQETAEYVIDSRGGTAHKITPVAGTIGINPAY